MNRRCVCTRDSTCKACMLIATRPDYAKLYDATDNEVSIAKKKLETTPLKITTELPSTSQPVAMCSHVGSPIRGPYAPDTIRDWHYCDHPNRLELKIADVVCSCRGCNPSCSGYEI